MAKIETPKDLSGMSAEDLKRGYKKGVAVTEADLCDVKVEPKDKYGAVDPPTGDVGSDY